MGTEHNTLAPSLIAAWQFSSLASLASSTFNHRPNNRLHLLVRLSALYTPLLFGWMTRGVDSNNRNAVNLSPARFEHCSAMTVVSQVRREPSIVARATTEPSNPVKSTTTGIHSLQTPTAPAMNESTDSVRGHDGSGSTLLFIAPFFGVVVLSFCITIGVKYCLRYNARNRVGVTGDNSGPNTRDTGQRPHRRRREKRLMTMEEVNEKFPRMNYETWVLERAREGLPTSGVVSVPASRANSVHETNDKVPDKPARYRQREGKEDIEKTNTEPRQPASPGQTSQTQETPRHVHQGSSGCENGDGDEHINSVPTSECPSTPIDTCAICISSLEGDEVIRALICGHAFHAACVDIWLTRRRACCPLCKANYYTPNPKPTPEGDSNAA